MSNELGGDPKLLLCPGETDAARFQATTFELPLKTGDILFTSNTNLSYFVGVNATETDPNGILSGDRNLTNGTPIQNGLLELNTNTLAGWTAEMHNKVGNIAMADGSVQQLDTTGLRTAIANASDFTNLLQMPILSP